MDKKTISSLESSTCPEKSFQAKVNEWLIDCFGGTSATNKEERTHRFLEEALELAQACGCSKSEAFQLIEYVYSKSTGDPSEEAGDVALTLAALCSAYGLTSSSP